MKITIDTKEDSHDDIRRVIKMLQNLVGDSQEISVAVGTSVATQNAFTNLLGDASNASQTSTAPSTEESQTEKFESEKTDTSESTEDLFAELFNEEELKKMEAAPAKEDEEEELPRAKDKKYGIEFY